MRTQAAPYETRLTNLLAAQRPLVIGHRGYCRLAPENTLPSFRLAIEAGADLVELDFRQSKDGQLIVIHDAELDRTTDARTHWRRRRIKVESITAAQIQRLDAGGWFHRQFAGTQIPTLAEALDTIQPRSITLMERKAGSPADCIRLLRAKRLVGQVVVQAFDWAYLRAFHVQEPEQLLAALGPPTSMPDGRKPRRKERNLNSGCLEELLRTGATIAVWNRKISIAAVRLAHEHGLKVWVYTVNDVRLANRLLNIGVDGIITNDPTMIRRAAALYDRK
jgi:glycerophosphoryl diester phosphodiesterase